MFNLLSEFHRKESGQDLIEYALVGLLIALASIAGIGEVSSSISAEYSNIGAALT